MSKAIRLIILVPLALSWLCGSALAQGGVTNSTKNPQQVATLHWYPANQTTNFAVGQLATRVTFDGANIWVARGLNGGGLVKLRASDGATLGTFEFLNLADPDNLLFDGANIWVGERGTGTLVKLRASDGTVLARCDSGLGGAGHTLAFDGVNLWMTSGIATQPGQIFPNYDLIKLRPSDCVTLGTFKIGSGVTPGTKGIAFDGANLWVAYFGQAADFSLIHTVTKVRATDGTVLGIFTVGSQPAGVMFDGTNIWVANTGDDTVTKLRASDGAVLATFPVGPFGNFGPTDMVFDGANIWVLDRSVREVSELRAADGVRIGIYGSPFGGSLGGIAFDGANIWFTSTAANGDGFVAKL